MKQLETHVKVLVEWFNSNSIPYALVGGIAVSFRAIERTTKDVDFAIAVSNDLEAENQIRSLISLGYKVDTLLEQSGTGRLSTVRLLNGQDDIVYVDLLYASCGIEKEIVDSSELIEIFPAVTVNVASLPALIAMKVLSANNTTRMQDLLDIKALLLESSPNEREQARYFLNLITDRGFNRKKNLLRDLEEYITSYL